jgi:hypothetical protein
LTCGFSYLDDGRGVLGPHPVRLRRQTGALAVGEVGGQLVVEEPRQPHDAPLVCLRRAPRERPVDFAERLGDLDLAAQQIEPLDLEAGDLPVVAGEGYPARPLV